MTRNIVRNSFKFAALAVAFGIASAWSGRASAQQTTSTQAMTFATASPQNLWASGAPANYNWCLPLALTAKGNDSIVNATFDVFG